MKSPLEGKSFTELTTILIYAFEAMTPAQKTGTIMMLVSVHAGASTEETMEFLQSQVNKHNAAHSGATA